MIQARDFVEAARERGFDWYAGVPCSYLAPFINYVLQERSLRYLSMANEGDAVALIAGVTLAGSAGGAARPVRGIAMMQNSGLGNAVSPLTSLTWTFRLPQLLIVTWRGRPGETDEPQHELMGAITPDLLKTMRIEWEPFPSGPAEVGPALDRAVAHMDRSELPYALVMPKDAVAPYPLAAGPPAGAGGSSTFTGAGGSSPFVGAGGSALADVAGSGRPSRHEALRTIVARTPSAGSVVLATTGYCGRELYAIDDRPNHLYMVGSMGCVAPFALGVALARPDLQVVAIDGDGAALMRMGAFATIGAYGPPNLAHVLLDNGVHESTGGQATVSPGVSFARVASACGYASAIDTADLERLGAWLQEPAKAPALRGARFARVPIRAGVAAGLPRPAIGPVDVRRRLAQHLAAHRPPAPGARG